MTLTKADAARQLGISRTTLYKLLDQGQVSATPDGRIDQAELVRIAPVVDSLKERTPMHTPSVDASIQARAHHEPMVDTVHERPWTDERGRQQTSMVADLVDVLREQVLLMREELREAREEGRVREARAQEREALLLWMLHDSQQRYDRLLDVPRPAPQVPRVPPPARRWRTPAGPCGGALSLCSRTIWRA